MDHKGFTPQQVAEARRIAEIQQRMSSFVFQTQLKLMDPTVSEDVLRIAGNILRPEELDEILEERSEQLLCAYPSCKNPHLPPRVRLCVRFLRSS